MMMVYGITATLAACLLGRDIWFDWKDRKHGVLLLKLAIATGVLLAFFAPAFLHSNGDFIIGAALTAAVLGGSWMVRKMRQERRTLRRKQAHERERQAGSTQRRQEHRERWGDIEKQRRKIKRARRKGKR